jgi:hypothetical protein
MRKPFSPDDHVAIEGHEGKVVRLTPRATRLTNEAQSARNASVGSTAAARRAGR